MSSTGTTRAHEPAGTLTEADAAHYIGMSRAYLRAGRQHGRGPAYVRLGRAIRYRPSDLDRFLDRHRVVCDSTGGR